MKIAIIGAGLAGTACAYVLKRYGLSPVIYEADDGIAPGASGNKAGLYNPRLSAERTPESAYHSAAFALALRTFPALGDIGWRRCGALHLITDDKKRTRYPKTVKNWGWPAAHMRLVGSDEATAIAGVSIHQEALYLPDSGYVSPRKLCTAYAKGVEVHTGQAIENLNDIQADIVIVACGIGALGFLETAHLPLKAVRGQVTVVKAHPALQPLKINLCYGGYCTPIMDDGTHMVGATFQRWLDHDDILPDDDADNIEKLCAALGIEAHADGFEVTEQRAGVRSTVKDHFPIVGLVRDNVYVSVGHGSHGILSSLMAAHVIADDILGHPQSLPTTTLAALSPVRF